jgi:hypothetical protein
MTREYFANLYPNILENLEEMDKFLDIYDIKKLNRKDKNRSIMSNEAELVIKRFQQRNVQNYMYSLGGFARPLKKN